MRNITTIIAVFILAASSITMADESLPGPGPSPLEMQREQFEGLLTRVVSADTVEIDGIRYHLTGVSAPVKEWWGKPRDCHALEAASLVEEAVLGQKVKFSLDDSHKLGRSRGRKRIYLYSGERFINAELIADGHALADRKHSYPEREMFLGLEDSAKLHMLNLWHTCPVDCNFRLECRSEPW